MPSIKMIQMARHRWRIESFDGKILLDDIILENPHDAKMFIKSYASSFPTWDWEFIPREKPCKKE